MTNKAYFPAYHVIALPIPPYGYSVGRNYPVLELHRNSYLRTLPQYLGKPIRLMPIPKTQIAKFQDNKQQNISLGGKAYIAKNFYSELYNKVRVIPPIVNLGDIATTQNITLYVWNALFHAVNLTSIELNESEGIEIKGINPPYRIPRLGMVRWTINVSMEGPASFDYQLRWLFKKHPVVTAQILGSRTTLWSYFPNWNEPIVENLQFLTQVYQSLSGAEQRISQRLTPRRYFDFSVLAQGAARQQFLNALYAYGARTWGLPVFTDATHLVERAMIGDTVLKLNTVGYDFQVGGRAFILHKTTILKEMVDIVEVNENSLTLKRPLTNTISTEATIYPLKSAKLDSMPMVTQLSDNVSKVQVRLRVNEANPYHDDVNHLPQYCGFPVLEPSSDWSEDLTLQYLRLIKQFDNNTGLIHELDTARKPFQVTQHRFVVYGRAQQHQLRQLFYYLRGRQRAIWVTNSSSDMTPTSDLKGNYLEIEAINYLTLVNGINGRAHVRIEAYDGRIFYRKIVTVEAINTKTEGLTFDGELVSLKQEEIVKVNFLTLSRLHDDNITWQHVTDADGTANITVNFLSVREDLENPS